MSEVASARAAPGGTPAGAAAVAAPAAKRDSPPPAASTSPSNTAAAPSTPSSQRKLSAAAKEWTPPATSTVEMLYPTSSSTLTSPSLSGMAGPDDATRDPDDAEDEEELAAVVAQAHTEAAQHSHTAQQSIVRALCRAVEYLLSNQSLWMHAALQSEMSRDPSGQGFVSLSFLASLKEVQSLLNLTPPTKGLSVLVQALQGSEKLCLNGDKTAVRRLRPLPTFDQYKDSNRTIFCERLPQGSTVRSLKQMFSRFGRVTYVLRADEILGHSGTQVQEKGQLSPHTSPKLKGRSMSTDGINAGTESPGLRARRLTGHQSPQLTGLVGNAPGVSNVAHLSPAQRNHVLAALSPSVDPSTFTAAFIQFVQSASAKKAVSSIVAYNKALKAATPKGSPRMVGGARRQSLGPGGIPTASLGHAALGAAGMESASTPPRSRSIRISTPLQKPADSPSTGESKDANSPPAHELLPPSAHSVLTGSTAAVTSAPPRHGTSPPPLHPLSPNADKHPAQRARGASVSSASGATSPPPPFVPTTQFTSALSPAITPSNAATTSTNTAGHTAAAAAATGVSSHIEPLPELTLGASQASDHTSPPPQSSGMNPLLVQLPESFCGVFTMPKISYLKSLKEKAARAAGLPTEKALKQAAAAAAAAQVTSPLLGPMGTPASPLFRSTPASPQLRAGKPLVAPFFTPSSVLVPVDAHAGAGRGHGMHPSSHAQVHHAAHVASPKQGPAHAPPAAATVATTAATAPRVAVAPSNTTPPAAAPAAAPAVHSQLSAKAPEFSPSGIFSMQPAVAAAAVPSGASPAQQHQQNPSSSSSQPASQHSHPSTGKLVPSSSSPPQAPRVLKSNWRSDGLPPTGSGNGNGVVSDFFDDPSSFKAKSPLLGPHKSPSLGPHKSPSLGPHKSPRAQAVGGGQQLRSPMLSATAGTLPPPLGDDEAAGLPPPAVSANTTGDKKAAKSSKPAKAGKKDASGGMNSPAMGPVSAAAATGASGDESTPNSERRPSKFEGERPKFTLTRRPSAATAPATVAAGSAPGNGSGNSGGGGSGEHPAAAAAGRQVVSRFALGPDSVEAVGFGVGRGRVVSQQRAGAAPLPPAGGGKPL